MAGRAREARMRSGAPGWRRPGWALLLAASLSCVAVAGAQAATGPDGGTLNPTFTEPALPSGMIAMDEPEAPSLMASPAIHGTFATGIATHGGAGVGGAVSVPIVPGVATLDVSGSTGQTGVLLPPGSRQKWGSAKLSTYGADLHVRPTDDMQVDISVSGGNLRLPGARPTAAPLTP